MKQRLSAHCFTKCHVRNFDLSDLKVRAEVGNGRGRRTPSETAEPPRPRHQYFPLIIIKYRSVRRLTDHEPLVSSLLEALRRPNHSPRNSRPGCPSRVGHPDYCTGLRRTTRTPRDRDSSTEDQERHLTEPGLSNPRNNSSVGTTHLFGTRSRPGNPRVEALELRL